MRLIVLFKNKDDEDRLHTGLLLSSVHKLETSSYIDLEPRGRLGSGKFDWKKQHIKDVKVKDIVGVSHSLEAIKNNFPEYFI